MRLQGKVALITGGGSGIGEAMALRFAAEGAATAIVDLNQKGAERVVSAIQEAGGRAHAIAADVANEKDVRAMLAETQDQFGPLHILVNNAGVLDESERGLTQGPDDSFLTTMQVNVHGPYYCTKRILPLLLKSDDPRILNVGSGSGILGPNMRDSYGVSKAALHALTLATANELKGKVTVNALDPGWVRTDMSPNGPRDPRWSAEGALSIVTRSDGLTGRLFYGKRLRAWTPRPTD